ncbi:hypothetical protein VB715_21480 [Crocosphaera sp. UHCC 0190]|uniref:hypothetical protein n=1 Tax=Crocosphaera sp. UHCC 0190 TaxID=3110246 RepID=UPI002B1F8B9A|nr:hypothetical protein [Crocosphaera sp. UHCC 0190]MEA5512349.1 hypothetical protein [Crocosphaera sp. UHCC 0190]
MTDLRLWIPTFRVYTYPDIMVVTGQPIYFSETETLNLTSLDLRINLGEIYEGITFESI